MKELTTYQMVVTRGEMLARLPVNKRFRDTAPGSVRPLCEQHVAAMEAVIDALNVELDSRGVPRVG